MGDSPPLRVWEACSPILGTVAVRIKLANAGEAKRLKTCHPPAVPGCQHDHRNFSCLRQPLFVPTKYEVENYLMTAYLVLPSDNDAGAREATRPNSEIEGAFVVHVAQTAKGRYIHNKNGEHSQQTLLSSIAPRRSPSFARRPSRGVLTPSHNSSCEGQLFAAGSRLSWEMRGRWRESVDVATEHGCGRPVREAVLKRYVICQEFT
ncbi:hypothetical protein C8Q74DRAFT_749817 [Fomes fomentarius]|nr:hypothetical protein C8Q74DRAFT_749817 [Fomes fomentarius]